MHVPFPLSLCPAFLPKVSPSLSPFLSTAQSMPLLFALSYLLGLMCLVPGGRASTSFLSWLLYYTKYVKEGLARLLGALPDS